MTNLSVFEFESDKIRFVDEKPVANDIAHILGFKDPANAVNRLVKAKKQRGLQSTNPRRNSICNGFRRGWHLPANF